MIAFIVAAAGRDGLGTPPNFGFHLLTGDRKGMLRMVAGQQARNLGVCLAGEKLTRGFPVRYWGDPSFRSATPWPAPNA